MLRAHGVVFWVSKARDLLVGFELGGGWGLVGEERDSSRRSE